MPTGGQRSPQISQPVSVGAGGQVGLSGRETGVGLLSRDTDCDSQAKE